LFKKSRLLILLVGLLFILTNVSCQLIKDTSSRSGQNGATNVKFFYNKPSGTPTKVRIKIIKSQRALELFSGSVMIGRFKIGLGYASTGDKKIQGDGQTPNGTFFICTRIKSQYKYFLGISYPNKEDAKRGLKDALISQSEYDKINQSIDAKVQPPWNTKLGGAIGLHGTNDSADWTAGCIALSEKGIDAMWAYAKLGTPVEIVA